MEHVPTALAHRIAQRTARCQRCPVHGFHFHVETGLAQFVGCDLREGGQNRHVGRLHDQHFGAVIARRGKRLFGGINAACGHDVGTLAVVQRRAAGEYRITGLPELRVADRRSKIVFLLHGHDRGPTHIGIVERRMQVVEPGKSDVAKRVIDLDRDIGVIRQNWRQIGRGRFKEIHLAGHQRIHGCGIVREIGPDDLVHQGPFAPGRGRCRLIPRDIILKLGIDDLAAGHPFVGLEHKGARPGVVVDLLERIGCGNPRRHDERHIRRNLADGFQNQPIGRGQCHGHRIVGGRFQ